MKKKSILLISSGRSDDILRIESEWSELLSEYELRTLHLSRLKIRDCEAHVRCIAKGSCAITNDDGPKLWTELVQNEVILLLWHEPAFKAEWERIWKRMAPRAVYNYHWHGKLLLGCSPNKKEMQETLVMMARGVFQSNEIAGSFDLSDSKKAIEVLQKILSGKKSGKFPGWGLKTPARNIMRNSLSAVAPHSGSQLQALADYARKNTWIS